VLPVQGTDDRSCTCLLAVDRKPEIDSSDPAGAAPDHTTVRGELELCNVTFKYPSRPEVGLLVPAWSCLAAAGHSSSWGKGAGMHSNGGQCWHCLVCSDCSFLPPRCRSLCLTTST
jgi:hypothetical protein